jgi:DnaJ-class molecular chaperone
MPRYFDYPRERERDTAPLCGRCDGTGYEFSDRKYFCAACQGTGYAGGREP